MCCSGGGGNFPSPDEIGQAQARYNRIDQYTPWGSLTYSGPNRNIATQTMTPAAQALMESMMGVRMSALNQLSERYGATPFPLSNPTTPTSYGNAGGGVGDKNPLEQDPEADVGTAYPWEQDGNKALTLAASSTAPATSSYDPNNPLGLGPGEAGGGDGPTLVGNPTAAVGSVPGFNSGYGGAEGYTTGPYGDIGLPYQLGMEGMDLSGERKAWEAAYMDRARGLLDPVFADKQAALDQQMANRGMPTGAEETELLNKRLGEQQNDAYTKAALDAVLYGGSEVRADRGQTLAERLSQFQTASQARQQLFGEDTQQYNQLASILGLTPTQGAGGDLSGFFGPGMVDMMSPYQLQAQLQMSNQQFGGDILGGILGLGGQLGAAALI